MSEEYEYGDWGPMRKCPECGHIELRIKDICTKCGHMGEVLLDMVIVRRVYRRNTYNWFTKIFLIRPELTFSHYEEKEYQYRVDLTTRQRWADSGVGTARRKSRR